MNKRKKQYVKLYKKYKYKETMVNRCFCKILDII